MNGCPSSHELKKLLDDSSNTDSPSAIEAHVKICVSCQNTLTVLSDETDVANWRQRLQSSEYPLAADERLHLKQVLAELKSHPPVQIEKPRRDTAEQIKFPGPPSAEAPLGQLGEYNIMTELGSGTFGTVYEAFDRRLERKVAIKVLNPEHATIQNERNRFEREARAVSRLAHDHIVRIYDVRDESEFPLPYLVMELIDGRSLTDQLARQIYDGQRTIHPRRAARIAWQVSLALEVAHEHGLVHRDIKSSNIMLERSTGRAKVTDFGLAREMVAPSQWSTCSGRIIGTLPYMSPEQILTPDQVDARSDLYSLGIVLYELLTGERPFRGTSPALLLQVAHDDPQSPRKLNPAIPRDLETICLKCLEKEPLRRYASAAALAEELQRFLASEPIRARPVPSWERVGKWAKRQPNVAALLAVVVLVTILGFAGVIWQWQRAEQGRHEARSAQGIAERARDRERILREQLEKNLYFHRVGLAHREWLTNNLARADQLLDECPVPYRGWEWRYLRRLFHPEIRTLRGHNLTVRRVTCSPNGQLIASVGGDWNSRDPGNVIVWDAHTGERLHTFAAESGAFHGVDFSPDSKRLAAANADEGITVWNLATGRAGFTPTGRHIDVKFSPSNQLLAGAGVDGKVRIWDTGTGELRHELTGHKGNVFCVAFSPDGISLASTGADGTGRIWETETGKLLHVLSDAGGMGVAFSPDGRFLAGCGYDGRAGAVKLWEISNAWEEVFLQRVPSGPVTCLSFSPDGRFLALNNVGDGAVRVWEATTGRERRLLHAHPVAQGVAFSPDGRTLVSSGSDSLVKLWDVTRRPPVISRLDKAYVPSLAFSPDSSHLALAGGINYGSGRGAKSGQIWDVTRTTHGAPEHVLVGHDDWLTSVAYSADGSRLVSADQVGAVRIWDTSDGRQLRTLLGHNGAVTTAAFSPDGTRLASGGRDTLVKLWDAQTGKPIQSLEGHQDSVNQITFSQDGDLIASASEDHTARLWDAATGRALCTLKGHNDAVNGVAFDYSSQLLATCGRDGVVHLWEMLPAGRRKGDPTQNPPAIFGPLRTLQGHATPVTAVSFSSDASRLASISDDGVVKLWDVTSGHEAITLTPFGGGIPPFAVAFSADGTLLAASRGHDVTLWDTSDRSQNGAAASVQDARRRAIAWHGKEATACENSENWFAASFHLCQLIALEPREPTYYLRRGNVNANRHQRNADVATYPEKAMSDYEQATQLSGGLLFTGRGDQLIAPHIPFDQYKDFTIEAWVYGGFKGSIVGQGKAGDPENSIWFKGTMDSYGWESRSGLEHDEISIQYPLPLQWNHVALVYDGTRQLLFANGKLLRQREASNPGPFERQRTLIIGGCLSNARGFFSSGLLKSIRISRKPLYDSDFVPSEHLPADGDTVLLYDFAQNRDWMTSSTVLDQSGNGNDGTLHDGWQLR